MLNHVLVNNMRHVQYYIPPGMTLLHILYYLSLFIYIFVFSIYVIVSITCSLITVVPLL